MSLLQRRDSTAGRGPGWRIYNTGTALARRGHGAHLWASIGARDTFTLLIGPEVASTQPSGVWAITLST